MYLLGIVPAVDCLTERLNQWVDDQVSDLNWKVLVRMDWLHNQFHELTSRSINSLCLLKQGTVQRFNSLSSDELESHVNDSLDVSLVAVPELDFPVGDVHVSELSLERMLNVLREGLGHNVLNEFTLSIEDNITQLSEVFDNNLWLIVFQEENLSREASEDFVVVQELVQDWIQNSLECRLWVWKPWSARQTQCWIVIVKDLKHVVKSLVAT